MPPLRCRSPDHSREATEYPAEHIVGVRVLRHMCRMRRALQHAMPVSRLDAIDIRILAALQDDASLTNVDLARRVGLSPSPCLARVRALEESEVILRRVTSWIRSSSERASASLFKSRWRSRPNRFWRRSRRPWRVFRRSWNAI